MNSFMNKYYLNIQKLIYKFFFIFYYLKVEGQNLKHVLENGKQVFLHFNFLLRLRELSQNFNHRTFELKFQSKYMNYCVY
jgi:hypothetical protein